MPDRDRRECARWADDLAEAAFAVCEPADVPGLAAHLDGCAACRRELEELAITADRLALLAPEVQPPGGFAERVLAAMGVARGSDAGPVAAPAIRPLATDTSTARGATLRPRRAVRAVAAAAVVVLVGLVGFAVGRGSTPEQEGPGMELAAAPLVGAGGQAAGTAVVVEGSEGAMPAVTVTLMSTEPGMDYRCDAVMADGTRVRLGTWSGSGEAARWTVADPAVRDAMVIEVSMAGGAMVGTARF